MTPKPSIVADYMTRAPATIGADQPLTLARDRMREHRCRHLPVLSGGQIVGVVSERDLNLIENLSNTDLDELTVEEAISGEPYCVGQETPLAQIAARMATQKFGSCVILRDSGVVGILTTVDICRALVDALESRTS